MKHQGRECKKIISTGQMRLGVSHTWLGGIFLFCEQRIAEWLLFLKFLAKSDND